MNNRNRIPLNEEKLDSVSGGWEGHDCPTWLVDDIENANLCQECLKKYNIPAKGRVYIHWLKDLPKYQVDYSCPAGHSWQKIF